MKYLFVHQNFPGQYLHIVRQLVARRDNQVYFITQPNDNEIPGVVKLIYPKDQRSSVNCHPYAVEFDRAVRNGNSVAEICRNLRDEGLRPDLMIGHSGWGETLFLKNIYPEVPLLANFEFFYHANGVDVGFDPEFTTVFNNAQSLHARNATNLLAYHSADWAHTATRWQRSLYPSEMRKRMSVIHEGIDTDLLRPNPRAAFRPPALDRTLTCGDEVLTYVARNLEPYRGFHTFMRALPRVLSKRKRAHVLIIGGDGVSYGAPPPPGSTFRQRIMDELGADIDPRRVHFLGHVDYGTFVTILQLSSVHVYLTYPFVLSWSFLEAMACGCLVIGSATPPVQEVLRDNVNGLMVDFFSATELASRIEQALKRPDRMQSLRAAARATIKRHFELRKVQLPRWNRLMQDLIEGRRPRLNS